MNEFLSAWKGYEREPLPWSWREKVLDFLKPDTLLLDLAPGEGGFLLSLEHPRCLCTAMLRQGQPEKTAERLSSSGVAVARYKKENVLPFGDNSFDLVLNNGGSYNLPEIYRVLKGGGFFLTQQRGGQDSEPLRRALFGKACAGATWNLENQLPEFSAAGFRVMYRDQGYPVVRLSGKEALLHYVGQLFETPEGCSESALKQLEQVMEERGFVESTEQHFIIIGKKK